MLIESEKIVKELWVDRNFKATRTLELPNIPFDYKILTSGV
jgi:hypothetical protein